MASAGDDLEHGSGNHAGFRRARPDCFKHMMTPVWLRQVTVGLPPIPRGCRSRRVPGCRAVARSEAQSRSTLPSPLGRPAVDRRVPAYRAQAANCSPVTSLASGVSRGSSMHLRRDLHSGHRAPRTGDRQDRPRPGDTGARCAELQDQCGTESSNRGGIRPARIIDAPAKMLAVDHQSLCADVDLRVAGRFPQLQGYG